MLLTLNHFNECFPGYAPGIQAYRHTSTEDDEPNGRPKEAAADENIKKAKKDFGLL